MAIKIRKAYSTFDKKTSRRNTVIKDWGPSRTKQSLAEDLDVNKIIKRYNKTGILQKAHEFEGVYGEFDSYDLAEAIEKVDKAREVFLEVPSEIRSQFNDDPGAFIDYATNGQNIKQLQNWGMAKPAPVEEGQAPQPTPQDVADYMQALAATKEKGTVST